jgi:cytochrome P450
MHSHPKYWGKEPLTWNPGRHVILSHDQTMDQFDAEVLAADTSNHFLPWAWGQRVCPGKRFSQVELVAVLAVLFRDWRVEVVPEQGETLEQAQRRAWASSLEIDHQGHMLHEMVSPQSVGLVWKRRN